MGSRQIPDSPDDPRTIAAWLTSAQLAENDLKLAELAYRRAKSDLDSNVRSAYFAVLVAQESMRANDAVVNLADEVYHATGKQPFPGQAASYEAMQLSVLAQQARVSLIQAHSAYAQAWKNLATTLGLPGMPPTQLAGHIVELKIPTYKYDEVLAHVLKTHTDVLTGGGVDRLILSFGIAPCRSRHGGSLSL